MNTILGLFIHSFIIANPGPKYIICASSRRAFFIEKYLAAKSSASSRSKKKSNDQSDSSSRRDSAPIKAASGSIKSTKPITQTVGGFAESATQPIEESAGPIDTITPSIEPVPSDSKLPTSRPPSPMRPPNFVSESLRQMKN